MTQPLGDLLNGPTTPDAFRTFWPKTAKGGRGFIGKIRPWAWFGEIVRGCNLRCGFCATRTFKGGPGSPEFGKYEFMTEDTFRALLKVIKAVSPYTRLEIGNAGEPTLHPQLPDFIRLARETLPHIQMMVYTNGTTLMNGTRTYKQLFDAGLNILYVDLYHPVEVHMAMADKAGYPWVFEGKFKNEEDRPFVSPFTYRADKFPNFRMVHFHRHPGYWSQQRKHRHGFSTFYNHLDWRAAEKYGLTPVTEPANRRCDFPLKFPVFEYTGRYVLCCWDFTGETAGWYGSVHDGVEGFFTYWFGLHMQRLRQFHFVKNRRAHPICTRCATVGHRGDIPYWTPEMFGHFWTGHHWEQTPTSTFGMDGTQPTLTDDTGKVILHGSKLQL